MTEQTNKPEKQSKPHCGAVSWNRRKAPNHRRATRDDRTAGRNDSRSSHSARPRGRRAPALDRIADRSALVVATLVRVRQSALALRDGCCSSSRDGWVVSDGDDQEWRGAATGVSAAASRGKRPIASRDRRWLLQRGGFPEGRAAASVAGKIPSWRGSSRKPARSTVAIPRSSAAACVNW